MTTSTTTAESDAYLAAVRDELDDLPEEERTDLLEDLAQHLADISANRAAEGPSLVTLLGPPAQYAKELRSAADLPPRTVRPVTKESFTARLGRSGPARLAQRLWRQPLAVQVREFVPQLRPAWWVLRGYLLIAVPWWSDSSDDFPIPSVGGSNFIGLIFTLLAIAASVAIGKRQWGKGRWLVYAGNIILAIFALTLLDGAGRGMSDNSIVNVSSPFPESPLASKYGPVTNIFPYSADGTPLENVLLYDQDGRPLRTAMQLWWAYGCMRMLADPKAADGVDVEFSYPKNYVVVGVKPGQQCETTGSRPVVPVPVFPEKPEAPIVPERPEVPADPNAPLAPQAPAPPIPEGRAEPQNPNEDPIPVPAPPG